MPESGRRTRPFWISCGTTRAIVLTGMAKPTPALSPVLLAMAVFMPIMRPWLSKQRAAGVAGIDRGVDLDDRLEARAARAGRAASGSGWR